MILSFLRKISFTLLLPSAALAENWGRGPVQATDLFPIALGKLNYYSSSPEVTSENKINIRSALHWANTINGINDHYLVDAETREQLTSIRLGLNKEYEVGLHIPLLWRGSGFTDSFIYDWHKFWGFPQGPRQSTEQDRYEISGIQSDQSDFNFTERGLKLGDIRLSVKKLLIKGDSYFPALASEVLVSVPTGSYSNNGFELLSSLSASKKFGLTYLYLGTFFSVSENKKYQNVEYERFRYGASANIEVEITKNYSAIFGLNIGSNYTSDISRLPNYQLYADLGVKYDISDNTEFEFLIRENPAPDRGSSDFSFLLALNSGISL